MMRKRHTRHVRDVLPEAIEEMLGSLQGLRDQQNQEIERLQNHNLSNPQAHDLMIETVRAKAFLASKIPRVIEQWDHPNHEEFAPRTAWSLLNAFTEVQKSRGASAQIDVGLMRVFRKSLQV